MPIRVTEVQGTPNPNARKFLLDQSVSEQPVSYFNAAAAAGHELAAELFQVPGVSSLLLLGDFITVNKQAEAPWDRVEREVRRVLLKSCNKT
jgi:NFU1 iron-sulfur cluster scaffold homolog, mitochondrial